MYIQLSDQSLTDKSSINNLNGKSKSFSEDYSKWSFG